MSSATTFYDFKVQDAKDNDVDLSKYKGKVVLIVNTASECGFTPQYQNLEKLYQNLKKEYPGEFEILGFPCNQFGGQEPGSNEDIQNFCSLKQKVTFPVLAKVDVKDSKDQGTKAHPLYGWLQSEKQASFLFFIKWGTIKWNFEKFLIGRDGQVKGRWNSTVNPESLQKNIVEELKKGPGATEPAAPVAAAEAKTEEPAPEVKADEPAGEAKKEVTA